MRSSGGLASAARISKRCLDTDSAAGEPVFHVFGAIAHFERRLIAERTKDGILAARARGKRPGRQPLDQDKVAAALKLVVPPLPAPGLPVPARRLQRVKNVNVFK